MTEATPYELGLTRNGQYVRLASDTGNRKTRSTNPTEVAHEATASMPGYGYGRCREESFLWGHLAHNDQQSETDLLRGEEAGIDASWIRKSSVLLRRDRSFTGGRWGPLFFRAEFFSFAARGHQLGNCKCDCRAYTGPMPSCGLRVGRRSGARLAFGGAETFDRRRAGSAWAGIGSAKFSATISHYRSQTLRSGDVQQG